MSARKQKSSTSMHRSRTGAVLSDDATENPRPGAIWFHDGWRFAMDSKHPDVSNIERDENSRVKLHLWQARGGRWFYIYETTRNVTRAGGADPRVRWYPLEARTLVDNAALTADAAQILATVLWP